MAKDKTIKTEIIVKQYTKDNHDPLVSIGWKKIGTREVRGDFIVIPKSLVPKLIDKLKEYLKNGKSNQWKTKS